MRTDDEIYFYEEYNMIRGYSASLELGPEKVNSLTTVSQYRPFPIVSKNIVFFTLCFNKLFCAT